MRSHADEFGLPEEDRGVRGAALRRVREIVEESGEDQMQSFVNIANAHIEEQHIDAIIEKRYEALETAAREKWGSFGCTTADDAVAKARVTRL